MHLRTASAIYLINRFPCSLSISKYCLLTCINFPGYMIADYKQDTAFPRAALLFYIQASSLSHMYSPPHIYDLYFLAQSQTQKPVLRYSLIHLHHYSLPTYPLSNTTPFFPTIRAPTILPSFSPTPYLLTKKMKVCLYSGSAMLYIQQYQVCKQNTYTESLIQQQHSMYCT